MDARLEAAARLLAAGDVLAALDHVALRDDPDALALRGIAMAQLGDLPRARDLLRTARRAFEEADDPVAAARCLAAGAEVDIALRDVDGAADDLEAASSTLHMAGDHTNAAYAQLVLVRLLILTGRIDDAQQKLATLVFDVAPPTLVAVRHLLAAEVAIRRVEARTAEETLVLARRAALATKIAPLVREVDRARTLLDAIAARAIVGGVERDVTLAEVEVLFGEDRFVVDACRKRLCVGTSVIPMRRRSTLFGLLRELALAGTAGATRERLFEHVFGAKRINDSHRARLRVDTSRLRKMIRGHATITATADGFVLESQTEVVVLLPPIDTEHATLVALLADGESWSTSALASATGTSQRTVQRALAALEADGEVTAIGRGRARRWLSPPLTSIATSLLLPFTSHDG